MTTSSLKELANEIEAALEIGDDLALRCVEAAKDLGGQSEDRDPFSKADLDATDRILLLVYEALPGWTVSIQGKAWQPNGHWRCRLRQSSSRDNDELIGLGHGPTLPHALIAALFRVVGQLEARV